MYCMSLLTGLLSFNDLHGLHSLIIYCSYVFIYIFIYVTLLLQKLSIKSYSPRRAEVETAKFKAADVDKDQVLSVHEVASLFYPETWPGALWPRHLLQAKQR